MNLVIFESNLVDFPQDIERERESKRYDEKPLQLERNDELAYSRQSEHLLRKKGFELFLLVRISLRLCHPKRGGNEKQRSISTLIDFKTTQNLFKANHEKI